MSNTEIIAMLTEIAQNAIMDINDPNFTIIRDVKPSSFKWVMDEAVQALQKTLKSDDLVYYNYYDEY